MRKVVLYTLLSLDGVAESPDQFLFDFDEAMHANLARVISAQDTVLLGRRTYDEWAPYWPDSQQQPFADFINGASKHVVTSTEPSVPWAGTTVVTGDAVAHVRELKRRGGADIGVHGSIRLARTLLAADLVDELRLVIAPALAGTGRKLFDDGDTARRLTLLRTETTPSGAILAEYAVAANASLPQTHTLATPAVDLVYDVRGPLPPADARPVLLMIGQPMTADGFAALAAHFTDRTVVTYDPRGLGRSVRKDGRDDQTPQDQAADLHLLIEALGTGPVEVFASSGGAVTALELVATHPGDVATLVAHEPPINAVLPDAAAAGRAQAAVHQAYQAKGAGAGMAAFIAMTLWQGEYTDDYFAQPLPDPAAFGMPTEDDGTRDHPLLSNRASAITAYRPDVAALTAAPTRIVVAVGEESAGTYTARTSAALAALLGQEPAVFPSHHGGFSDGGSGYPGKPEEFAARLREVL